MSFVFQLDAWAARNADALRRPGTYALRHSGRDTSNPSAQLIVEVPTGFVELLLWDSGEAEFSYGPFGGARDEHHELSSHEDLLCLLTRFLSQATALAAP